MGAEEELGEPGRVGVGDVAHRDARSKSTKAAGSPVRSSANASARASTWRDSTFEAEPSASDASVTASAIAGSTIGPGLTLRVAEPVAARECLGEPLRQEGAGRRHQREPGEPAQQVVVLLVAQLVRDHAAAPRRAGSRRSGCRRARRAWSGRGRSRTRSPRSCGGSRRRGRPRPRRLRPRRPARSTSWRTGPAGSLLEVVEDRIDHDRPEPDRDHAEGDDHAGGRRPPVAPEAADQHQREQRRRRRRRRRRSRLDLTTSTRPVRPGLGGEPDVERARALPGARAAGRPPRAAARSRPRPRRRRAAGAGRGARAAAAAGARRAARACPRSPRGRRGRAAAGRCGSPRRGRAGGT